MIDFSLFPAGILIAYILLKLSYQKSLDAKYKAIRNRTKHTILGNKKLFFKQHKRLRELEDERINIIEQKNMLSRKHMSDEIFYKNEIVDNYKSEQHLNKNKKSQKDSDGSGAKNDNKPSAGASPNLR